MKLSKIQLIVIGIAGLAVLILILMLLGIIPGLKAGPGGGVQNVTAKLKFWTFDASAEFYTNVINNFKKNYPNVSFEQRNFTDPDDYESAVIDALATGQGPDIFMVKNLTVPKNAGLIFPLPPKKFPLASLRQLFPQIVEQNFAPSGKIYGLNLSIDTLALIYNRDLFNQMTIVSPPTTWEEFQNLIPKLAKINPGRQIIQAAAAIGGSEKSISRAGDLLSTLMLQDGTQMVNQTFEAATFASEDGLRALNFYAQFTNAAGPYYTWSDYFTNNSLDAFSQGKVAMIFNYADSLSYLKSRNAFLNIAVSPIPQPSQAVKKATFSRYWAYTVSRQSRYPNIAWSFILNLTTNADKARNYIEQAQKPPALNVLINKYLNDPDLGIFSRQTLIARSWPQIDDKKVSDIFSQMIEMTISGRLKPEEALAQAQDQVSRLIIQR